MGKVSKRFPLAHPRRFVLKPDDPGVTLQSALLLGDRALPVGGSPYIGEHGAAAMQTTLGISVKQAHFDYGWYPFDKQSVRVTLALPEGANITTCGTAAFFGGEARVQQLHQSLSTLLTRENGWRIDGPPSSFTPQGKSNNRCTIEIPIERIPDPYIYQNVIPATLVCIASLMALLLNSESADTTAGRTSVLLVAMLLLVEKGSDRVDSPAFM